ncbi:hypothetical protein J4E91_001935 [Alternaria rosae]|nr:hypothetical protein J4E91_001935 [Alternaria rosae]
MARTKKRARADPQSSQSQPQLRTKRQRGPKVMAAQVKKEADDTTAPDDVRYMRTQPKAQAPTENSRAKSFPSQTSKVIDLTLSDELDDVFPAYSSRSEALQGQAEEQRHPKYALQSKTIGKPGGRSLGQFGGVQGTGIKVPDMSQGDERWTLPSKPLLSADILARCQHSEEARVNREKAEQKRERKRKESAINAQRAHASVMFTLPGAVAVLWQPQLVITYDLPTGAYVPCQ